MSKFDVPRDPHPLEDEEEVQRILLEGSDKELEALRAFRGGTTEQVMKARALAREYDRAKHADREEVKRREISAISPEELSDIFNRAQAEAQTIFDNLNDTQRKALNEIACLPLDNESRFALELIAGGLKPSTEIFLPVDRAIEIVDQLSSFGLAVTLGDKEQTDQGEQFRCSIAKDVPTLERLKTVSANMDDLAYGELMGFPKTAAEAYVNKMLLETNPDEINPDMIMPMRLSKDHWPKELYHLARWSYFVKIVEKTV